jgi:hypothetical protein
MTTRVRITAEEAAADPTNVYDVRVPGDMAVKSIAIHHGPGPWLHIEYANGASSTGTPPNYHTFVRIIETEDPTVTAVRDHYGNDAADLVSNGWTVDAAIAHVNGTCDILICGEEHNA